jgi:hypothetical protein
MGTKSLLLKFTIAILFLLSVVLADEHKVGAHNIGAAAGFVTGYGLSYRQWIGKYGVQATCAPYYEKNPDRTNYSVSFGVTGLRTLIEANFVNLFLYAGPHFWYGYNRGIEYDNNGDSMGIHTSREKMLFAGGGPGIDFHFWKLSFNVMVGLAFHSDFDASVGINFTGETGLYYSF